MTITSVTMTTTMAVAVNATTGKHPLTTSFTPPLTMPIATTLSGEDEDNDHVNPSIDDGDGNSNGRHLLITLSTAHH